MDIFIIEDNKVLPTPEVLLIEPFKTIWKKNTTELALLKFAYIEFMSSYKKSNPFIGYKDNTRSEHILSNITTKPIAEQILQDELIIIAIEAYKKIEQESAPSIRFYEATVIAADKLIAFFNDLDITKIGPKGYVLYKPADITRALKDTNDIIKTLNSMKEKVMQELSEAAKGKSGREINYFEKSKTER